MLKRSAIFLFLSFSVLLAGILRAENHSINTQAIESSGILNLVKHENNVYTGGQPTTNQLGVLAQSGIKHVINLRPEQEQGWHEAEFVQSLGVQYHSLPISGAIDITSENAARLAGLLSDIEGQGVLLHCASGNRVGALMAVSARDTEEMGVEESVSKGKRWGLGSLEGFVRVKLSGN
jgi:uncharacterized protein (TIGR01244 family)